MHRVMFSLILTLMFIGPPESIADLSADLLVEQVTDYLREQGDNWQKLHKDFAIQ